MTDAANAKATPVATDDAAKVALWQSFVDDGQVSDGDLVYRVLTPENVRHFFFFFGFVVLWFWSLLEGFAWPSSGDPV